MPELHVAGLTSQYGQIVAVRDLSFSVPDGGAVGVLGANGAGKSTLMRTLAGLHRPTAGTVTFDGADITGLSAERIVRRGVALVPEGRHVFKDMTVEENLLLGGYSVTRSQSKLHKRLPPVYDLFPRLAERRRQLAGTLSGGEQQMVALGRGLMSQPTILLLDEPSLGLAPIIVAEVMDRLAELRRATGMTIILVEQNLHVARRVVDRCIVIARGELVADGSTEELMRDDQIEAAYLGAERPAPGGE